MSMASAYGFSAWDPIGSFGEGSLNSYFWNKNAKESSARQLASSKDFSTWSATQLPSLQVQGLKAAGLNPILAAPNSIGGGAVTLSAPSGYDGGADSRGGFSASDFHQSLLAKRSAKLDVDAQAIDNVTRLADAESSVSSAQQEKLKTDILARAAKRDETLFERQYRYHEPPVGLDKSGRKQSPFDSQAYFELGARQSRLRAPDYGLWSPNITEDIRYGAGLTGDLFNVLGTASDLATGFGRSASAMRHGALSLRHGLRVDGGR